MLDEFQLVKYKNLPRHKFNDLDKESILNGFDWIDTRIVSDAP